MTTYRVWCPGDGEHQEDGVLIRSNSPDCAAAEWVEKNDQGKGAFRCVGGQEMVVKVREEPDGSILIYHVDAEVIYIPWGKEE